MTPINAKKIFNNLDKKLSIFVIFASILPLYLLRNSKAYVFVPLTLIIAATIYLVLSYRRTNIFSSFKTHELSQNSILIINILYVLLFTLSLWILTYTGLYTRSVIYFGVIILIISLLTFEIIKSSNNKNKVYIDLLKIILLSINLRVGIQFIFPNSFITYDPWYHKSIIDFIINTGHVPENLPYSSIAGMHMFFTIESYLSDIANIFVINSINTAMKSTLSIIFIFLISNKIFKNPKISLLASLMYVVLDRTIIYDVAFSPTAFTMLLTMGIIFLLIKQEVEKKTMAIIVLILILMAALITSHTLTAVFLTVTLISFEIVTFMFKRVSNKKIISISSLILLFGISLIAWWSYASGYFITQLVKIFQWGFQTDLISPTVSRETNLAYLATLPIIDHFLNYLGFYIFIALSTIGLLLSFNKKNKNFAFIAILGFLTLVISFAGISSPIYIIPDRWWYYAQHILPIVATIGILYTAFNITKSKKISTIIITVLFVSIAFFSISDSVANMDSPFSYTKNIATRNALTQSEIQSVYTLNKYNTGVNNTKLIYGDGSYLSAFQSFSLNNGSRFSVMDASIYINQTYTDLNGIIIFRKYVLEGNPFQAEGIYKLNQDPLIYLNNKKLNKIYDSYTVYAFER